jgi:hypothetical protein
MESVITDKDLCAALTSIFTVIPSQHDHMCWVALHFEQAHVKDVLMNWLAPQFCGLFFTVCKPAPICDPDELLIRIQTRRGRENKYRFFGRIWLSFRRIYVERILRESWMRILSRQKNLMCFMVPLQDDEDLSEALTDICRSIYQL